MNVFEVPLSPQAQYFDVTLLNVDYNMVLTWNAIAGCWVLDIYDPSNVALVLGIPLITGADLLSQFGYLGFGGGLIVTVDAGAGVPTFDGLGSSGHLYFIVPEASDSAAPVVTASIYGPSSGGKIIIPPTPGPSA